MAARCPLTPVARSRKRKCTDTPEIDLTQPEQQIYESVRESQDTQALSNAIITERAGLHRTYVLGLIRGRMLYLRGQRSRSTHVDLNLSQEGIRGQCRTLEDTQELCRALQEELESRNRKSVVQLLRARIQHVQARQR